MVLSILSDQLYFLNRRNDVQRPKNHITHFLVEKYGVFEQAIARRNSGT